MQKYNAVNRGISNFNISNNYTEICDTGSLTTEDSLPSANYCDGKIDLRALVPTYLIEIPKDTDTSVVGGTGYELAKGANNQISLRSGKEELSQVVSINPLPLPTPEELIQAQISAGILVPTGTQQTVFEKLLYTNNAGTQTYIDKPSTTISCPTGYISVPGNSMYGTGDFCVMKYEAKAVDINNPTVGLTDPNTGFNTIANNTTPTTSANGRRVASVASGYPIANIDQATAAQYCTDAGATLISNAEAMTIARNIEGQAVNWYNPNPPADTSNNIVGSGGLWRGHSDNNPPNALVASMDDNAGYTGTNNSISNGWQEKRTHTLSNGEVIWDLSGNLWEWTTDTVRMMDQPYSNNQTSWAGVEFDLIINNGTLNYDYYRPSNLIWNSSNNMGQLISHGPNSSTQVFGWLRGGSWQGGWGTANYAGSGLFSIGPCGPSCSLATHGFRCTIRN